MTRTLGLLLASSLLLAAVAVTARVDHAAARGALATTRAAASCANFQLLIRPFRGSGAAGHYGEMYRIHNLSNASCSLSGFPGVVLLDAKFSTLPTHLTWSTTVAGNHPVRVVNLASGGNAYFLLYWADIPTGSESCPAARYLMITPPNDKLPNVTYAMKGSGITPCGGRMTASPVAPTPFVI